MGLSSNGGRNHRGSIHYLIESYHDYGPNEFLPCLEAMSTFWLIEFSDLCLFSRVPGPNSTQIFSLWSSTHQAMCTLSIGVFAITKTIIHGVQTYICRNVTYCIETLLTWYTIDDVKLHYTAYAQYGSILSSEPRRCGAALADMGPLTLNTVRICKVSVIELVC